MKRILLDTHVFLWWLIDSPELGEQARQIITDSRNDIYVSAASTWEISIKRAIGKLTAPSDISKIIEDEGFLSLAITTYHGDQAGELPPLHRDPFDRMLIAQAQAEGLILMTNDGLIKQYPLRTLDANT
jgi:PIN domain nuclease of toxin-antitoxin system